MATLRAIVDRARDRFQAAQRRHPALGLAVSVQERYGEVHAGTLASSVAIVSFLSLFPLILVGIAILGFVSAGSADLAPRIVSNLGLTGEAAKQMTQAIHTAESSRRAATAVGLVGLAWSGLALVGSLQHAYNRVWQVEGRGWRSRPMALLWLLGASIVFLVSIGITTTLRYLPGALAPLSVLVGFATGFVVFLWSDQVLPNRDVPWRALVPGAVLGAVGLEVLKAVGSVYVPRLVERSSALYGSLGVVFAVLAWLMLFTRLLLYGTVLNVVRWERAHGTRRVELDVPSIPGTLPDGANRSGQAHLVDADVAPTVDRPSSEGAREHPAPHGPAAACGPGQEPDEDDRADPSARFPREPHG